MAKIPEKLKVRAGDKFEYGKGKGIVEVTEVEPFGQVWLIERTKCAQWFMPQRQIRMLLKSGAYKRMAQAERGK